jgi:hypothetical protein
LVVGWLVNYCHFGLRGTRLLSLFGRISPWSVCCF